MKEYYSCWDLLFAIGELFVNHAPQAGEPDKISSVYEESAEIFERIERESHDAVLARTALSMRAYCFLALKRPVEAIDLLEGIEESQITIEQLLVKAYAMKGDTSKAKDVQQKQLYQNVLMLFAAITDMIGLYADDTDKAEVCITKAVGFVELFDLEELHPASCFSFYLISAGTCSAIGKTDRALELLEAYVALVTRKNVFPIELKGNDFFDRLDSYFASLNIGTHAPRSDALIRRDIVLSVTQNPAFETLKGDKRFQQISDRLEHWGEARK